MTDRFKEALFRVTEWVEDAFNGNPVIMEMLEKDESTLLEAITLATESEQLRKRLAELETLIEQANKKSQWYERTEATND